MEGTMLHRVEEGGMLTFIDDAELARVQHMMYYCHECCAYHVRDASAKMDEFIALLNQEVESA